MPQWFDAINNIATAISDSISSVNLMNKASHRYRLTIRIDQINKPAFLRFITSKPLDIWTLKFRYHPNKSQEYDQSIRMEDKKTLKKF